LISHEQSRSLSEDVHADFGMVQAVHEKVAAAVKEMQGALQAELHEDQIQLFRRLGRGGFGTVYHGALLPSIMLCY
jgi:hypothetical protein